MGPEPPTQLKNMEGKCNPFAPQVRGKSRVLVYRSTQEDTKSPTSSSLSPTTEAPKDMPTRDSQDESNESPPTVSFLPIPSARYPKGHAQQNLSSPDQRLNLENPSTTVWPYRLLHVGTMTVYTRTGPESTCYRSPEGELATDPPYNILSYTWGRFQTKGDTSVSPLQVNGIDWNIPSIDPRQAFGVEDFRDLLLRLVGCNEFVWVDVACIDQRKDRKEYKEEIGNQIGIFHRAKFGYIWLHQLSEKQLQEGITAIVRAKDANSATANDIAYIEAMCKDPWFSSLWTLQEAYLRKSAILLSKTGVAVFTPSGTFASLRWLLEACEHPWAHSSSYIKHVIRTAGLDRISARNPVVLLAAARYRETKHPLDRIKGIMQVFGLNIGNFLPDEPEPSLFDLELELSQEINKKCPALAQAFVHVDRAATDQAWRLKVGVITPARRSHRQTFQRPGLDLTQIVPPDFFNVEEVTTYKKRSKISFIENIPVFEGLSFSLESLLAMWEIELPDDQAAPQLDEWMPYMNDLTHSIYMDNVTDVTGIGKLRMVPCEEAFLSYNRPLILARDLAMYFPGRIRVLILGKVTDNSDEVFMGILTMRRGTRGGAIPLRWCRVGFCTWVKEPKDLEEFSCFMG